MRIGCWMAICCLSRSFSTLKKSQKISLKKSSSIPIFLTENQEKYLESLNNINKQIICGMGPAGSGKTMLACNSAMAQLKKGMIDKIVVTRPMVAVGEELGYLPGNIQCKMEPWTRPIFDLFLENCSQRELTTWIEENIIEISPLAYMRGRTFKNAFIIADEMQNSSPNQMFMLLTRLGEGTKIAITGDLAQSDYCSKNNGLYDFIEKYNVSEKSNHIEVIHLCKQDVKRSLIVQTVMDIYSKD
jgi:phosphate starvation-inducible PhoH-like protein